MKRFALLCMIYWQAVVHGFDPRIVTAQVFVESSFRPAAINGQCVGLMQINVPVWREALAIDEPRLMDPAYNLHLGLTILRIYYRQTGDIWKALYRYNAGYRLDGSRYVRKVRRALMHFYGVTVNGVRS